MEIDIKRICDIVSSYAESRGRSINEGTTKVYLSILKKAGYLSKHRMGKYRITKLPEADLTYSIARDIAVNGNSRPRIINHEAIRERVLESIGEHNRAFSERERAEESRNEIRREHERAEESRLERGFDVWSTEEVWDSEKLIETELENISKKLIETELENITDGKRREKGKSFFFEEEEFKI
jgi:hypothetical protein